ncbi:MAG TPA: flavin prenyltransferase UbiX [Pirellulales bacterium]|jgi:4-hydroxy-3-polyprenylbenzoate decarboxylase|nr:flavin prenyltransferase UbiX [Pirellulales bacterium]
MTTCVLGITGASGAIYAVRLLDVLLTAGCDVQLAISPAGQAVLKQELDVSLDLERFRLDDLLPSGERLATSSSGVLREVLAAPSRSTRLATGRAASRSGKVRYYHYRDFMAPMASGSARNDGMVVCPCSGGTLAAIAQGVSENLIHRAADVQLKERRKLVLVPRETPLSLVHLDNMRRATEAGAVVLPAMPGFYHGARSLGDLVDFVVARICDQLGVEHHLVKPWGSDQRTTDQ